ncbi:NUDIX hydrolase [candidate division TM7 genomosp. GTL1]|nr:NUDIX hydrolase [candidate division TM7 genomosp. GTL1]
MALKHWKKQTRHTLFEHPRLTIYEDEIMLPNGTVSRYLHFGMDVGVTSVTLIVIRDDGKILLQKELSYPTGEFLWQWPGGGLRPGETFEEAANRELMEEAGLYADSLIPIHEIYLDNRRHGGRQAVVIARNLHEAKLPADAEELFEYRWMTEAQIDQLIADGEAANSQCLAVWALYKARK